MDIFFHEQSAVASIDTPWLPPHHHPNTQRGQPLGLPSTNTKTKLDLTNVVSGFSQIPDITYCKYTNVLPMRQTFQLVFCHNFQCARTAWACPADSCATRRQGLTASARCGPTGSSRAGSWRPLPQPPAPPLAARRGRGARGR